MAVQSANLNQMKKHALFLILFSIMSVVAMAQGSVSLRLVAPGGGNEIAIGEKFYIYYTLKNMNGEPSEPKAPDGANKLAFTFSSSSSSMTSVNGRTTQSHTDTYVLYARAVKEGKYTFGPVTVNGVKSNSVTYSIVKQRSGSSAPQAGADPGAGGRGSVHAQSGTPDKPQFIGKGDEHLFLRATANRATAYEQEAIEYTVKLYSTYSRIKFIGATDSPKFDGFVVEESDDISHQLTAETYNGKTYATAVIARYVIFPQMAGKLKVIGNTYTVSADRSEVYNLGFWGNVTSYEPVQLNVTPNDLTIDVKALPTPRPADFSGGVGQFSITSSFDNSKLLTNTAAGIKYTVTGKGNLKYVTLPDLNALYPKQLEVFSPTTDVKANVGRSNVSGSVSFDYSFMPLEEGTFTIPPVRLCYFNPETGRYETSEAKGYTVTVGRGTESAKSQTRLKKTYDTALMNDRYDISKLHVPYVYNFLYWLIYIIPCLGLVTVAVVYRRHIKAMADVSGMKSRKAGKVALKRLKTAAACLKAKDEKRFYDEMLIALWGYLGDKLKMPTSELSRQNVAGVLSEKGVGEPVIKELIQVIDDCEFAKYSPHGGMEGMQEVYVKGCDIIDSLEDFFSKKKPAGMSVPQNGSSTVNDEAK